MKFGGVCVREKLVVDGRKGGWEINMITLYYCIHVQNSIETNLIKY